MAEFAQLSASSKIKEYFDKRKVDEQAKEKAKRLLTFETVTDTLRHLRARRQEAVSEAESQAMLKWLQELSRVVPITEKSRIEELLLQMEELGYLRAKLNALFDIEGLKLMDLVQNSLIRYYTVVAELRRRRNEWVPYYFSDDAMMREMARVLLHYGLDDKLERLGFPTVRTGDLLDMLKLNLACADSASQLDDAYLLLRKHEEGYLMIPTGKAVAEFQQEIDALEEGKKPLVPWLDDVKPVDVQGFLRP
ncbi:MAG: hypothetical protein ACXAB4_08655 [Candidatus Hodarchaeales archaeon]|jgi:hypothetical protein